MRLRRLPWLFPSLLLTMGGCVAAGQVQDGGATAPPFPAHVTTGSVSATPGLTAPPTRTVPVPNSYRQALAAGTRSVTGAPGPAFWSNRPSYRIDAELDPARGLLRGRATIAYRNGSPSILQGVVLNLYQNIFSEGVPRNRAVRLTGGVSLHRVAVAGVSLDRLPAGRVQVRGDAPEAPPGFGVEGTLARIRLPHPLHPGDSVVLEIEWEHLVPPAPTFRTAWEESLGTPVFQVAQWYPQIAMYDDLVGWNETPYLGDGEFYLPYGDFEVALTVPVGYLVGASGELLNPEEVLTPEARARLEAAVGSDSVTRIVTGSDLTAGNGTRQAPDGELTWRFRATDVRDFAFSTSPGYVWDATRVVASDPAAGARTVAIHALYREGATAWSDAAAFARHSMRFFGSYLPPYVYPQLTIAEGPVAGMEYPMIMFVGRFTAPEQLYAVIAHEAAHQWFPMMVGSDEAAHAWLDEGLATFLENRAVEEYFRVEDAFAADRDAYLRVAGSDTEVPLMRHTDLVSPFGARTVAAYSKPSLLMRSLEWLVGPSTFREALNDFAAAWHLRNATPWDFFGTVERHAGRPLGWFLEPWWFGTGVLDLAITGVEGAGSGRAVVTIENLGTLPAPAIVRGTSASGGRVAAVVGADGSLVRGEVVTVVLEVAGPIVEVVLDPLSVFPDVDRGNDRWEASGTGIR